MVSGGHCFIFLNCLGFYDTTSVQVVSGLLIAEVNVNTMRELGSGGVSLVSLFHSFIHLFGI